MGDINKRAGQIIELLKEKNGVSVKELAYELDVTEMTIRRDIKQLKAAGIVKNVAGAILLDTDDEKFYADYITKIHEAEYSAEKVKLGQLAAGLIEENDVVYIDVGTTTVKIIDAMDEKEDVTVVCATINALNALQKKGHVNYCITGGMLREKSEMLTSSKGVEMLKDFGITKAFISAAGVNAKLGVTCINEYEVPYKKTAMQRAVEKYLVVDSSKFGVVRMSYFANLSEFDAVVTDRNISEEWAKQIEELGIRLYLC